MAALDIDALNASELQVDPFEYVVVPGFVHEQALTTVNMDFPTVPGAGSYPPARLDIHGQFAALLKEMEGPEFTAAISEKFNIDLSPYPTMFTVRGHCRASDGKIHSDSDTKIITILLYLNPEWSDAGGRLRLLRSATDLNDIAAEVSPNGGTLLAFRRCDHSWHGHEPFEGERRAIQMNWVTNARVAAREQMRHRLSAAAKRLNPFS